MIFENYLFDLLIGERTLIGSLMNWNIRCRPAEEWRQILAQTWLDAECVRFETEAM